MSGICGIWNLDGLPVDRRLLATMSGTMVHRGPDGEGLWSQEAIGLACQQLQVTPESVGEVQPLVHSSGVVLVFDGRLDNREELLRQSKINEQVSITAPDTAFVLATYRVFGRDFAQKLIGDFALALFDPALQCLILARDAMGTRPLYFYRARGLLLFGTEIKSLLAHPNVVARPNDITLGAYLVGYRGSPDSSGATFFEDVFSVPPAHIAVQTKQTFLVSRYWDFDPNYKVRYNSTAEYAAAFRRLFETAVRRRMRSVATVAVSVSGGLDSSSILCMAELLRQKDPLNLPSCKGFATTCDDGSVADERSYLVDIEQQYEVKIERMPLKAEGFAEGSKQSIWYTEDPMLSMQATAFHKFNVNIQRQGARIVLTGFWGDQVLTGTNYMLDLCHGLAWRTVNAHLKEMHRWMIDVSPAYFSWRKLVRQIVLLHVPASLVPALIRFRTLMTRSRSEPGHRFYSKKTRLLAKKYDQKPAKLQPQFNSYYAEGLCEQAKIPYYTQLMDLTNKTAASYGTEVAYPFFDRDLLSFLIAIPGHVAQRGGVSRWILREAMHGVLPESIRLRRWKADFTRIVNDGAAKDAPLIEGYLGADSKVIAGCYVDQSKMSDTLAELVEHSDRSESIALCKTLATIFGLELWLRKFF